ncbi:RNA-guided endonuclease InsQ/TnpB family protein [Intestinibacter sp.]|uniref:RNA-guided endonuclease InsQ/TnpB family protein n=1 Tax=Intestinibacter sp. TaxID=1965304 RepID=UPI002A908DFB|nr:RNA-guided endonuclease TnpB family protein [Intestinibacter sp.]MDY5212384.1 RNA-guided endonuclease TnpB family protein [Intestinibacter sp.]
MIKSYKVRLEPNKQQEKQMFFQAGCARHIYNWTLAFQKERYEKGEKFISAMGMSKYLTAYKKENEWLRDCDSITLVSAYTDACTAFKNFFREVKKGNVKSYPRFKSKNKTTPAFAPNYQAIKISENQVKLPKIGIVKLSRKNYIPIVKKYSNPRVTYDGLHWYISVGVEQEDYKPELNPTVLGVDLGVKDLAIVSDGTVYKNINKTAEMKKLEKKLKRLQRQVSKKYDMNKDGKVYHKTNNIIKLEKQILKLQHRIRDIRNNYRHTMTHQLVEKKPHKIVIEDLNVKGMMKNKHLSDAIGKQGFYEIQRQLQYKTQEYGIELVMADRWYPSSQTCSKCGHTRTGKDRLKLKDRTFTCPECGHTMDRDLNAAINLSQY